MSAIDLKEINWNKLSVDSFRDLHKQIEVKIPKKKNKKTISDSTRILEIAGKQYEISNKLYLRYINLKSQKSKEKLLNEIVLNYKQIEIISL